MPERALNVGSGQRPFKSTPELQWINIDSQERWNPDLVCNAETLPFEDSTIEYVMLHHVLEHFGCGEGQGLIREANRVLRHGGRLFVCVPNMRALAEKFLVGIIDTQIYMTNVYGAYMGDDADRHKWGYTQDSLRKFLKASAPWSSVTTGIFIGNLPGSDIAHDWWILEAEAVK